MTIDRNTHDVFGGRRRARGGDRRRCGTLAWALLAAVLALAVAGAEERSPDPALAMWQEIRETDDPALLLAFVEAFPESPYAHAARARILRLREGKSADEPGPRKRRRSR